MYKRIAGIFCQGICGETVEPADLREDAGFEVCSQCAGSPEWEAERQRRLDAMRPAGPRNVVGRPTVKG